MTLCSSRTTGGHHETWWDLSILTMELTRGNRKWRLDCSPPRLFFSLSLSLSFSMLGHTWTIYPPLSPSKVNVAVISPPIVLMLIERWESSILRFFIYVMLGIVNQILCPLHGPKAMWMNAISTDNHACPILRPTRSTVRTNLAYIVFTHLIKH